MVKFYYYNKNDREATELLKTRRETNKELRLFCYARVTLHAPENFLTFLLFVSCLYFF